MNRFWHVHNWGDPIFLAEGPEGEGASADAGAQSGGEQSGEQSGEPLNRETRGFINDSIRRAIGQAGFVTEEKLGSSLDAFSQKITGSLSELLGGQQSGGTDEQATGGAAEPGSDGGSNSKKTHETDTEVRLRRLEAQLTQEREGRSNLEKQLQEERQTASIEKRNGGILSAASEAGARDPEEILLLTQSQLVQDDEKGWLYEVDGEFGKEFLSPADYIPKFLAKKPHLKRSVVREGAGAGGGQDQAMPSSGGETLIDGRPVTEANLSDPDWYNRNRPAIQKVLNQRMQSYQRQNPTNVQSI